MERHSTKIIVGLITFFIVLLAFSGGYMSRDLDILPSVTGSNVCGVLGTDRVFFEVLDELMENHYTQPTREELIVGAIEGMIISLDDPYTTYFDLEEAEAYQSNFSETYVGVGVTIRYDQENIIIVDAVTKDGPAYRAGIKVNDIITHIDEQDILNKSFYEVVGMVVGEIGTEVTIGVWRLGYTETLHFPVTRAIINNSSVDYTTYERDGELVGHVKVNTFGDQTFPIFAHAITELEALGIDSLVIDLRNNGGGHLLTVYYMMNLFLVDDGNPIFATEYYSNGVHYFKNYVASNTVRKTYNIVTLVNENSASASEVFASGMQEHGGYAVVGTTTFGKGTMQTDKQITATLGDSLHITIGKWTTANGGWVHTDGGTDGITPDVIQEQSEIENAYKVFLLSGTPIEFDTVDIRVSNIQIILNMMGYDLREDGYFDQETLDAINEIQTNNTLPVTGEINGVTLNVINEALDDFINEPLNDSQLEAAILYLLGHPTE